MNVPQPLAWLNRNQLTKVNRSQPFTVSWSGGSSNDVVGVLGIGQDLPANSSAAFLCLGAPGATSITVPTDVLANVPATSASAVASKAALYLISAPAAATVPLTAKGLDAGFSAFVYVSGKTVTFQ
jgi:hypothetical protein